jgi:hypothetical protein
VGILGLAQGFVALAVTFLPAEPNATLAWWLFIGAGACVIAMGILLVWPQKIQEPTNPGSNSIGHQDNRSVTSHNQMGGQTAYEITNVGPQPRKISEASASALVAELSQHPNEQCTIDAIIGDTDAYQLAQQLKNVLNQAGWSVSGVSHMISEPPPKGVTVRLSKETPQAAIILINRLNQVGLQPTGYRHANYEQIEVIVGSSS